MVLAGDVFCSSNGSKTSSRSLAAKLVFHGWQNLTMSRLCLFVLAILLHTNHAWLSKPRQTIPSTPTTPSPQQGAVILQSSVYFDGNLFHQPDGASSLSQPSLIPIYESSVYPRKALSVNGVALHLLKTYERLCQERPLVTKSVTSAVISALGNILSQFLQATLKGQAFRLNLNQMGAFSLTALLYIGPFYHVWYDKLSKFGEWMSQSYKASKGKQTLAQILVDQTLGVVLFFPLYFYVFEICESLMHWRAPLLLAAHHKCAAQLGAVVIANWHVWPFLGYLNFRFIPQSLRVLAVNAESVVWNAFFCALVAPS